MKSNKGLFYIFFINFCAIIVAYYISILLHEWGHGTMAWLYGLKKNPFEIIYGGWFLLDIDENVNYMNLINSNRGLAAALIAMAGILVSLFLVLLSFGFLSYKKNWPNKVKFVFIYWFLIVNMIPLIQYFFVSPFSSQGDMGRFVHGLNLSPWWVFMVGATFIILAIAKITRTEVPKSYAVIPIKSLFAQNVFLIGTLSILFLFVYTHGYNPLADKNMNLISKLLVLTSILAVPILFIVCNPGRDWVKKTVVVYQQKLLKITYDQQILATKSQS